MSMDIGGVDLRLGEVPRKAYDARPILAVIAASWPESVFEALEDEATRPIPEVLDGNQPVRNTEFFVYRDAACEITPEIGRLYWAIDNALVQLQARSAGHGRKQGKPSAAGDLQAAGSSLSPQRFGDIVSQLHSALYPEWTALELRATRMMRSSSARRCEPRSLRRCLTT
jgi:hypothetical protein